MSDMVAVTGATGFIGRYLTAALAREGRPVRAIVRDAAAGVDGAAEHAVVTDLADRESVTPALRGAKAVVHLAGRAHVLRASASDEAAFIAGNVGTTRSVAEAAVRAGLTRMILVSSVAAVASRSDGPLTSTTPPAPRNAYGRSKLAAEAVAREIGARSGIEIVVLRPPLVYGPRMRGNPLRLFGLADAGLPIPVGAVRNQRSMAYVGNVAAAIGRVLDAPPATEPFFVSDGRDVSTPDFVRAVGVALGKPAKLVAVPVFLLKAAGVLGDVLPAGIGFPLTGDGVTGLVDSLTVDIAPLIRHTGYVPAFSLEQGLAETAAWYRAGRPA